MIKIQIVRIVATNMFHNFTRVIHRGINLVFYPFNHSKSPPNDLGAGFMHFLFLPIFTYT